MAVVYAAMVLPALLGIAGAAIPRRRRVIVPRALACSLIFFAATNFAVWAFSGMYSLDMAGLVQCYVAGAAVPEIHRRRRPVLGRGAVRRRRLVQRRRTARRLRRPNPRPQPAQHPPPSDRRASSPHRARHRLRLGELQADRDDAVVGHRVRHELDRAERDRVVGPRRMLDEIRREVIRQRACRRPPAESSGRRFRRARRASRRPARRNPRPGAASGDACGGRSAKKRSSACTRSGGARK